MVRVLNDKLNELPAQMGTIREDVVSAQILGLIFRRPMQKIWEQYEIHLYPYISKIKLLTLVDDGIKQTHLTNIGNVIHAFNAFVSGTHAFPEREERKEPWLNDFNGKLEHFSAVQRPSLLAQVLRAGKEVNSVLSYMNFEHMVTHCMEQDDTRVCVSKKLVGNILDGVLSHQRQIALQKPEGNDALIKVLNQAEDGTFKKLKATPGFDEKINYKLKTRLFVPNFEESGIKQYDSPAHLSAFVRCHTC